MRLICFLFFIFCLKNLNAASLVEGWSYGTLSQNYGFFEFQPHSREGRILVPWGSTSGEALRKIKILVPGESRMALVFRNSGSVLNVTQINFSKSSLPPDPSPAPAPAPDLAPDPAISAEEVDWSQRVNTGERQKKLNRKKRQKSRYRPPHYRQR